MPRDGVPWNVGRPTTNAFLDRKHNHKSGQWLDCRCSSRYSLSGSLLPPSATVNVNPELNSLVVQPADTLLSQINKGHGPQGSMMYRLSTLAREIGLRGLFAGLGPRCVMTAGLVAGQFAIYGAVKDGESSSFSLRHTI